MSNRGIRVWSRALLPASLLMGAACGCGGRPASCGPPPVTETPQEPTPAPADDAGAPVPDPPPAEPPLDDQP
jgi:hypothetical protein